jgi:hypothetical protein
LVRSLVSLVCEPFAAASDCSTPQRIFPNRQSAIALGHPMTLPNYFLADLPPEAHLTASMIREACVTIKRNREQYLVNRTTPSLIHALSTTAQDWLQKDYPFRLLALEQGQVQTGFSPLVLATGLDTFFRQLTPENLQALLLQDLGHVERLDAMVAAGPEQSSRRAALARGPDLLIHVTAGNLPSPALMSIVLGVLVRSAQFVKCATGTSLLPRLFAHSLYEIEPKLGACLEIAEWPGGHKALEEALFAEASCVTATGTDETLQDIRRRLPGSVRFLGYGHRVSFGYIAQEMLSRYHAKDVIADAAKDVAAWDQLGCLSPHVFYVQHRGSISPEQFAELLAEALRDREVIEPRGPLTPEESATIASRRAFYEVRAAHSPDTRQWCSQGSTAWTVVYEANAQFQVSCLNRFIYVKGVRDADEMLEAIDAMRGKISTVGVAAPATVVEKLAQQLARWGVARLCPLGQMQNPPFPWRHDGRPSLGDLVTWTDWER